MIFVNDFPYLSTASKLFFSFAFLFIKGCTFLNIDYIFADDEEAAIKPAVSSKKSSQNDLYMRLGLLLGDSARRGSRTALSPLNRGQTNNRPSRSSHDNSASSSLASFDPTIASNNTSPVSTLTGNKINILHHLATYRLAHFHLVQTLF